MLRRAFAGVALLVLVLAAQAALSAQAETVISGERYRVVDGDTIHRSFAANPLN